MTGVLELQEGVRVLAITDRGHPFVTEHRVGKGRAILVHCYSPQGHANFREFAEDIFHAVGAREQPAFRAEGNPAFSYATYGRGSQRRLYVQNTDLEHSGRGTVVGLSTAPKPIRLRPAQMVCLDWQ